MKRICFLLCTSAFRSVLTACVFFSDPAAAGAAIIFPRFPVTVSRVMQSIKAGSTLRINAGRGERAFSGSRDFSTVLCEGLRNITRKWNTFISSQ
ncbi:MAG: hypothetical protein ABSH01_11850 [Terriglobia bacterium]